MSFSSHSMPPFSGHSGLRFLIAAPCAISPHDVGISLTGHTSLFFCLFDHHQVLPEVRKPETETCCENRRFGFMAARRDCVSTFSGKPESDLHSRYPPFIYPGEEATPVVRAPSVASSPVIIPVIQSLLRHFLLQKTRKFPATHQTSDDVSTNHVHPVWHATAWCVPVRASEVGYWVLGIRYWSFSFDVRRSMFHAMA